MHISLEVRVMGVSMVIRVVAKKDPLGQRLGDRICKLGDYSRFLIFGSPVKHSAKLFVGPGIKARLIKGGIRIQIRYKGIAELAVIGNDFLKHIRIFLQPGAILFEFITALPVDTFPVAVLGRKQ